MDKRPRYLRLRVYASACGPAIAALLVVASCSSADQAPGTGVPYDAPAQAPEAPSGAVGSSTAGVGHTSEMRRDDLVAVFALPTPGFTFEDAGGPEEAPRTVGSSPDGLTLVELVGPPENLDAVSITIVVPKDNAVAQATIDESLAHVFTVLKVALPTWQTAETWLYRNVARAVGPTGVDTQVDDRRVELSGNVQDGTLTLTITSLD